MVRQAFVFPLVLEYLSFVNIKMGATASTPSSSYGTSPQPRSSILPIVGAMAAIALLFIAIFSFGSVAKSMGVSLSSDVVPTEVDGKIGSTVASSSTGSNMNLQFWMYIKDWDYKFGQTKQVIAQTSSTNPAVHVPSVTLHPTDNSLDINVSIYPSDSATTDGTTQTVTVENVPLQSWFAVSITIYGRNIDVYINGQLVQSAVLNGVPMPATGSLIIGGDGGFSGSVCTVKSEAVQLQPSGAAAFYAGGTACAGSTGGPGASSQLNNLSLFGYTFVFGVKDSAGKQVTGLSSSDVSGWFSSTK